MKTNVEAQSLEERILEYVAEVQRVTNEHYTRYPNVKPPMIAVEHLQNYARIVKRDGDLVGRSVHSFVALTDINTRQITAKRGDILKPASWKTPAKHARGSVFNTPILQGVTHHGPNYLRG